MTKRPKQRGRVRFAPMKWESYGMFALNAQRPGGKTIVVVLAPEPFHKKWTLMAIESSVSELGDLLDNHAHKAYPMMTDIGVAMKKAERIVREWLRSKESINDKCTCGPIVSLKAKR